MRRGWGKIVLAVFGLAVIASIALLIAFFYRTGGAGLARVVWHYLFRNIPDKEYSWADFRDRGAETALYGFYSGGDESGFYLWTLSGRKRFYHQAGTSIYMFNDVCTAVRQLDTGESASVEKQVTGNLQEWQGWIKQENLVKVLRLDETAGKNAVDKVWSQSGKYKIPGELTKEQCD